MRFDVLTLFPGIFDGYLAAEPAQAGDRAGAGRHPAVEYPRLQRRQASEGRRPPVRRRAGDVDVLPAGVRLRRSGAGRRPSARQSAVRAGASRACSSCSRRRGGGSTMRLVTELASHERLLLLCGRYEGFDERIRLGLKPLEVSVGDFVTNGGEVPAMLVIDTVIRHIPGVLGDETSSKYDSFADSGLLEYPQYTRPRVFRGMEVPRRPAQRRSRRDLALAVRAECAANERNAERSPQSAAGRGSARRGRVDVGAIFAYSGNFPFARRRTQRNLSHAQVDHRRRGVQPSLKPARIPDRGHRRGPYADSRRGQGANPDLHAAS